MWFCGFKQNLAWKQSHMMMGFLTTPGSPGTDIRSILMFISSPLSPLSSLATSRPPCLESRPPCLESRPPCLEERDLHRSGGLPGICQVWQMPVIAFIGPPVKQFYLVYLARLAKRVWYKGTSVKEETRGSPPFLKTITKERKYFRILTQDVSVILLINNDEEKIMPFYSMFFSAFNPDWTHWALDTLSWQQQELGEGEGRWLLRPSWSCFSQLTETSLESHNLYANSQLRAPIWWPPTKSDAQLCNLHRSKDNNYKSCY